MIDWVKEWMREGGDVRTLKLAIIKPWHEPLPSGRRRPPIWEVQAIDASTGKVLQSCGHKHRCPGSARDCMRGVRVWLTYYQTLVS